MQVIAIVVPMVFIIGAGAKPAENAAGVCFIERRGLLHCRTVRNSDLTLILQKIAGVRGSRHFHAALPLHRSIREEEERLRSASRHSWQVSYAS